MLGQGVTGGIYAVGEIFLFLVKLNVLWLIGTVAGLLLFGFGPSTLAMCDVIRRWMRKEADVPVWRTFWQQYKTYFLRGNGLTFVLILGALMIYVNTTFFIVDSAWVVIFVRYALFLVAALLVLTALYVFPATVHFDLTLLDSLKQSFFIALYMPLRTLYMVAAVLTVYHILFLFPVLLFLFGISFFCFIQLYIVLRTFAKLELKQASMTSAPA
ncbi:DUF624 domain-containing protein [Alkalihalobacillus sp. FSL W8-0930]